MKIAIREALVFDGLNSFVGGKAILIDNDTIVDVCPDESLPEGYEVFDASGQYVMPGLIDMHFHFYSVVWGPGVEDVSDCYGQIALSAGITTVRSAGERYYKRVLELRELVEKGQVVGPRIFTAGPYFQRYRENKPSFMPYLHTPAEVDAWYRQHAQNIDFVKVYDAFTPDWIAHLCRLAHSDGKKVVGHIGKSTARQAILAGIDGLEHGAFHTPEFWDATSTERGFYSRVKGFRADSPIVDEIIDLIVEHGTAITPTFVVLNMNGEYVTERMDRLNTWQLMSPSLRGHIREQREKNAFDHKVFEEQDRFLEQACLYVEKLYRRGGRILCGTDPAFMVVMAGHSLIWEAITLHDKCGIPNDYILRALTSEAAKEMGLHRKIGSIRPGYLAELVVMSKNPLEGLESFFTIHTVIRGGKIYRCEDLRRSMEGVLGRNGDHGATT
jgi:imidazolonepropionase-like amidohydrolase